MSSKESCRQEAEPTHEGGHVDCNWQNYRGGLPKTLGSHITPSCAQVPDMELQDLMFALLDFGVHLVPSLLSMPLFLSLGKGMFILCHCILEACNLFYDCFV
jgi:hypothetical protein